MTAEERARLQRLARDERALAYSWSVLCQGAHLYYGHAKQAGTHGLNALALERALAEAEATTP